MPFVKTLRDFSGLPEFSRFFADVAETRISLKNGYSITFENNFHPNDWEQFYGNFLILRDFDGKKVGVLEFEAKQPLVIQTLQGIQGEMPKRFFRETRTNFEEALIDAFLGIVHRHFPNPSSPEKPKVVFSEYAFNHVHSKKMRERILRKYCPKPALRFTGIPTKHSVPWFRVKESIFSKMRKQQRTRK